MYCTFIYNVHGFSILCLEILYLPRNWVEAVKGYTRILCLADKIHNICPNNLYPSLGKLQGIQKICFFYKYCHFLRPLPRQFWAVQKSAYQ